MLPESSSSIVFFWCLRRGFAVVNAEGLGARVTTGEALTLPLPFFVLAAFNLWDGPATGATGLVFVTCVV